MDTTKKFINITNHIKRFFRKRNQPHLLMITLSAFLSVIVLNSCADDDAPFLRELEQRASSWNPDEVQKSDTKRGNVSKKNHQLDINSTENKKNGKEKPVFTKPFSQKVPAPEKRSTVKNHENKPLSDPLIFDKIKELYQKGNYKKAILFLDSDLDPASLFYIASSYYNIALKAKSSGQRSQMIFGANKSIVLFKRIINAHPGSPLLEKAVLWWGVSVLTFKESEKEKKILTAPFDYILTHYHTSRFANDAAFYAASVSFLKNQPIEAEHYLETILKYDAYNDLIYDVFSNTWRTGANAVKTLRKRFIPKGKKDPAGVSSKKSFSNKKQTSVKRSSEKKVYKRQLLSTHVRQMHNEIIKEIQSEN